MAQVVEVERAVGPDPEREAVVVAVLEGVVV